MKKLLQKKSGFTLIELMIVVAILGILAAVAIPAFATYLRRSKTGEAYENIEAYFKSASAYYNKEFVSDNSMTATTVAHCIVAAIAVEADGVAVSVGNGDVKQTPANMEGGADEVPEWRERDGIGFNPGARYYSLWHGVGSMAAGCSNDANTTSYRFTANGNLDADGTMSTFSLATQSNAGNELYKAGQIYVGYELE